MGGIHHIGGRRKAFRPMDRTKTVAEGKLLFIQRALKEPPPVSLLAYVRAFALDGENIDHVFRRLLISEAIYVTGGNRTEAANLLGYARGNLNTWIHREDRRLRKQLAAEADKPCPVCDSPHCKFKHEAVVVQPAWSNLAEARKQKKAIEMILAEWRTS